MYGSMYACKHVSTFSSRYVSKYGGHVVLVRGPLKLWGHRWKKYRPEGSTPIAVKLKRHLANTSRRKQSCAGNVHAHWPIGLRTFCTSRPVHCKQRPCAACEHCTTWESSSAKPAVVKSRLWPTLIQECQLPRNPFVLATPQTQSVRCQWHRLPNAAKSEPHPVPHR